MSTEKIDRNNVRNRVVDINDPNVPSYVTVGVTSLMAYLGVTTEMSVYRAVNRGELPPAMIPGQWTVGQIREWRILMGRLANVKAIQPRAKELGVKYTDLTEFDVALQKNRDPLGSVF